MTQADDRTILVPRPGGKRSAPKPAAPKPAAPKPVAQAPAPRAPQPSAPDRTIVPEFTGQHETGHQEVQGIGSNPILDGASTVLSLIAQIRNTTSHQDIKVLHQHCIDLIRDFEHKLRNASLDQQTIYSARYCLCALLDETVLNTPWGGNSFWGMQSLLSAYHKEALGGEQFFRILQQSTSNPQQHIFLIEFQYACLSLGFQGKLRLEERGAAKLDDLRDRVFRIIRDYKGEYERELSPSWQSNATKQEGLIDFIPSWVIATICGAILLVGFIGVRYSLNQHTKDSLSRLHTLVETDKALPALSVEQLNQALQIKQLMQVEISRGFMEVIEAPGKITIRLKSENLFPSASAKINPSFTPILKKLALSMESLQGQITVTGHTDDVSIFSYQFSSNFELSLERANSVVQVMKDYAQLSKRITAQGKADLEPLVENNSEANRALNRRVDITISQY